MYMCYVYGSRPGKTACTAKTLFRRTTQPITPNLPKVQRTVARAQNYLLCHLSHQLKLQSVVVNYVGFVAFPQYQTFY